MARTKKAATTELPHVADICLYGTHVTGAGWLARSSDGAMFGNGEPIGERTFTEAVWMAAGALEADGIRSGRARVFMPGGLQVAWIELGKAVPTFGSMRWEAAPVYTLSVQELEAAADEVHEVGGM